MAYRATLDVPRETVWLVAKLLAAERKRRGTPGRPFDCGSSSAERFRITLAALVLTHYQRRYFK